MQTKHLGEMLCLLGEQTSQADYHLVTVNGLLVKLRQAARLWNTAQIVPIVKLNKKAQLTLSNPRAKHAKIAPIRRV